MKTPQKAQLISLVIILLFLGLVSAGNFYEHQKLEQIRICNALRSSVAESSFASLPGMLQAKAFYVYDFSKNTRLAGNNESLALPLASLTKLMTIRIALKNISENSALVVANGDIDPDGSIDSVPFVAGSKYSISDLVKSALIASSNDAAVLLSQNSGLSPSDFLSAMNKEAEYLNLDTLQYQSVTGLDSADGKATSYGSAQDILSLLKDDTADFPDLFAASVHQTDTISASDGTKITLTNTDLAIPKLPVLLASKTGYTYAAGGNLAVLWQEPGGDLIGGSVLGSTQNGRFADMIAIHDAADSYVQAERSIPASCANIQ